MTTADCDCLICELAPRLALAAKLPIWCLQCPTQSARTLARTKKPETVLPCSWCAGTGFTQVTPCVECKGTGKEAHAGRDI